MREEGNDTGHLVFFRMMIASTDAVMQRLINEGKVAIHFTNRPTVSEVDEGNKELYPCEEDWLSLLKISKETAIVPFKEDRKLCNDLWKRITPGKHKQSLPSMIEKHPIVIAEYFFSDRTEMYSGIMDDNSRLITRDQFPIRNEVINTSKKWKEKWELICRHDGFIYTTVNFRMNRRIERNEHLYWLIRAVQGHGSYHFINKPRLVQIIRAYYYGDEIPLNVNIFTPDQLELLCFEWLNRYYEGNFKLLLPIGRTLQDVDIFGRDLTSNTLVFAQVSFETRPSEIKKKATKMLIDREGVTLFYFGVDEKAEILEDDPTLAGKITYVKIQSEIFEESVKNVKYKEKILDFMINEHFARVPTEEKKE